MVKEPPILFKTDDDSIWFDASGELEMHGCTGLVTWRTFTKEEARELAAALTRWADE